MSKNVQTKKKIILLVDNDVSILDLYRTILEMEDYEIFTTQSGSEALAVLSKIEAPDLIVLDMRMEDMSGLEFLVKLEEKQAEIVKNVPVVFFSGMDEIPVTKASGFIKKPLDLDKFLKAVQRFIETGVRHGHI